MKRVACYARSTKIGIQKKIVLNSHVLISNKAYDTQRYSFEELKSRINHYLRKMMHTGEQMHQAVNTVNYFMMKDYVGRIGALISLTW